LRSQRNWQSIPATVDPSRVTADGLPNDDNTWLMTVTDERGAMVSTGKCLPRDNDRVRRLRVSCEPGTQFLLTEIASMRPAWALVFATIPEPICERCVRKSQKIAGKTELS
jgi:hypothetical protein